MSAVESTVNISFAKHFPGTQLDLVLCLPSHQSLGIFSFDSQAQVKEVQAKIEEMKGFSRCSLWFGDVTLEPEHVLAAYNMPKLAVVFIHPIVTVRSGEGQDPTISKNMKLLDI
jgi:hypothetical protein